MNQRQVRLHVTIKSQENTCVSLKLQVWFLKKERNCFALIVIYYKSQKAALIFIQECFIYLFLLCCNIKLLTKKDSLDYLFIYFWNIFQSQFLIYLLVYGAKLTLVKVKTFKLSFKKQI
jgi:hypothetical protein